MLLSRFTFGRSKMKKIKLGITSLQRWAEGKPVTAEEFEKVVLQFIALHYTSKNEFAKEVGIDYRAINHISRAGFNTPSVKKICKFMGTQPITMFKRSAGSEQQD